jgi:hypothetical protein
MKKLPSPTLVFAAATLLTACASPEPTDETHTGQLEDDDGVVQQDQSRYDDYEVDADEGWQITAEMRSEAFDSYLWLLGPSGGSLVQDDDGLGDGTRHSRITYTAPERGTYKIRANSYDGTGRGEYTLHISARPPSGAAQE